MGLAKQRFGRSNADLRQAGYTALIESLGYADAVRFLVDVSQGRGAYLELQERILGDMGVDELYEQAAAHWQQGK